MYSYTKRWDDWVYNQNIINDFWPDCVVVSVAQIFWLNYDIWVETETLARLVEVSIEVWILTDKWAVFEVLYNYMANLANITFKEEISVFKTYINIDIFKDMIDKWYNFGIWLQHWNLKYLEAVEKWVLTIEDVDKIDSIWGGFAHNHIFWKKWDKYWIFEIYKWKFIECDLDVLKYGVKKKVWRSTARTFKFDNEWLERALFDYKNEINIEDVHLLPKDRIRDIEKASRLRVFKKW